MSSIVIASLNWQTPNNTSLFTDLNLTFGPSRTGLVGRNGTGKTTLLRLIAGEITATSGTIAKPASVGFLRQNPEQNKTATIADLFGVRDQLSLLRRMETGEATEEDFAVADWSLEARMETALLSMGLDAPSDVKLSTLSGGQRTRAALAALIFQQPDAVLLDEPTNHLDRSGRAYLVEALREWQGCLVVASHDRAVLHEMDAIVELTTLGASTYGGNYEVYQDIKRAKLESAKEQLARAERVAGDLQASAQLAAQRKARSNRQGRRLRASGSQPKQLLDAAKERSEGSGGSAARRFKLEVEKADKALEEARAEVEVLQPLIMDIPPSGLVAGRNVLKIDSLRFGYQDDVPILDGISLEIRGPERISLEGGNGSGKSTLLACIHGDLKPQEGTIALHAPAALLDQDLSLFHPEETVTEAFARIDPDASENDRRAVLARFLFRGDDAQQRVGSLSGGQRLRAGLACTLGHSQPRQLLLLDEPSNHLDTEAIETLEAALVAYDGAILIVSHDDEFLDRVGVERTLSI